MARLTSLRKDTMQSFERDILLGSTQTKRDPSPKKRVRDDSVEAVRDDGD